jgi:DNA-binding NtrC family response regulator
MQSLPGVLIVEDDELVRSFLRTAIESTARVLEAHDVEEALRILKGRGPGPIDLMLLDYVLPGRSGLDLLKITTRHWPRIPVILMTAFGSEDLAVQAFRDGVRDYLKKPIALDALMRTVTTALASTDTHRRHFADPNVSTWGVAREALNPHWRFEVRFMVTIWALLFVTLLMLYIFVRG